MVFNTVSNGYDRVPVDAYITRITEAYNRMHEGYCQLESKCAELKSDNQILADSYHEQAQDIQDLKAHLPGTDISGYKKNARNAQKAAEDIIAKAKREAADIIIDARINARVAENKKQEAVKVVEDIYSTIKDITITLGGEHQ